MLLWGTAAFGQPNFFTPVPAGELRQATDAANSISKKGVFRLNEKGLRSYLSGARQEFRNDGITLPLEVPLPDGTTEVFQLVESSILSPEVAAANPDIKTYAGSGTRNKAAVIRISLTSLGFSAVILNVKGDAVYFEPFSKKSPGVYFNYFGKDARLPANKPRNGRCGTEAKELQKLSLLKRGSSVQKNSGAILRTFRIAVAANGEFTQRHGGTLASAFAVVVNYVNDLTAVYRNELSISFVLVSGTNLVYTDPNTDPYTNGNQSAMLDENQANLDAVIGSANYDVGHVWGTELGSGGGVASLQAVCDASIKGRGVSGEGDGSYAQIFNDQLFFHEIGHQFGMTHSYNSTIPVCTTRFPGTAVEPGSGATIMSYGFTCDSDDYANSTTTGPILTFHTVNYDQAEEYLANPNPGFGNCFVPTATGNQPPVVTVPGGYTIPKSTPFALTGSATDANGDMLTYSWEGTNVGVVTPDATTLANTAQPPFFRSYEPTTSPTRVYPRLSAILDGSNYAVGDKLPSVSIVTTHRLTVRDNNPAGGGVNYEPVSVTVNGNIGPFLVTNDLSGSQQALTSKVITWSVNGTNAATPMVKILLSTDGGYTFPTVLAASTPNDGSESVTLPNSVTTTGRIKIEAVGNIFFDISNTNFSITAPSPVNYTITATAGPNGSISPSGAVMVAQGTNQTFTITPASCYQIANVLVDGVSVGAVPSYTFTNVMAPHTIQASFSRRTFTITATAGPNGSISPSGATVVNCGDNRTFTITPASGFAIQSVLVDGVSQGAISSYTFSNVTSSRTISATFVASSCVPPTWTATVRNLVCNGDNRGAILITTTGGRGPFTYAWTGPNNFTASSQNTAGLRAGTYNLTVTGSNGCSAMATYTVTEPATPLAISVVAGTIACSGGSTMVTVSATGGTPPYSGTGVLTGQTAGARRYTVSDANGCTASRTIYIAPGAEIPPTPVIYGQSVNLCGGGTFTYRAKPSYLAKGYNWTVPQGFMIVAGQGTEMLTVQVPANFTGQATIGVAAFNDCGASQQGVLTLFAVAGDLSASISGPSTLAPFRQNVEYSVPFSGLTFTWTVPQGATIVSGQGAYLIKVNFGATGGAVRVRASNACGISPEGSKNVTVTSSPAPNTVAKLPAPAGDGYLKAFPNPAVNDVVLFFTEQTNTRYEIRITDANGKQVLTKNGMAVKGENRVRLYMGAYANSVYWVSLKTQNKTQTLKLVKAR